MPFRKTKRYPPVWHPVLTGLFGLALACAVRVAGSGVRDIWLDEAITLHALSLDWAGLIRDRIAAGHSPVYFLAMKALGLGGDDPAALRIASAVMDSLACGLLAAAIARHAGVRAGVLAAAFYALNPLLLYWGQNARPYGMMMLFLALAVLGAMGLAAGRANRVALRSNSVALSLGLSGAAAVLTGGAIAAAAIALSPLSSPALRKDRAFCRAWGRALILPAVTVAVMLAVISLPHAGAVSGTYWTLRFAPFTLVSAGIVALETVAGDRSAWLYPGIPLSPAALAGTGCVVLALLAGAVARACRDLPAHPEYLPLLSLCTVYPAILALLSLSTSLLVGRYFLPAVAGALMLAAIGAAALSRRGAGGLAGGTLLVAFALLALNQSLSHGWPRDPVAQQAAGLIRAMAAPGTRLLADPQDGFGLAVQTQVLIERPATPYPVTVEPASVRSALAAIAAGGPVFLAVHAPLWPGHYARELAAPDCLWNVGGGVVAFWSPDRPACANFSE